MNQKHSWLEYSLICSLTLLSSTAAQAQITPDNTLGTESSRLVPNVQIQGASADSISGGAQRGGNLFHSFSQFNVGDGQRVYFVNPSGVQNILTRVTGGQVSNILGTLGVDGNANLFLLNPNGIVFGPNARLDVGGSFVGTTANAFRFGEQGVFSATNPEAPSLLTVNPSALLFNQLNPGAIINRARFQETDTRSGLQGSGFLVGGDIIFDGGQAEVVNNRLELGGLAGVGAVELIGSGNNLQLNFPQGVPRADMVLQNNAFALTTGGGAIAVHARNLNLSGTSFISSNLAAGQGTPGSQSGDVVINATGTVTLDGKSFIANLGLKNSLGDTGDVEINAQSIRLTNGSQIATDGERTRGSIRLNTTEDVTLDNNSLIGTFGTQNSIGNSGDITVNSRNINLSNRAGINSGNIGQGRGGKTTLQVQDTISLSSGSRIFSSSAASVFGGVSSDPSGDIEIRARSLSINDPFTGISSSSFQGGRSGDIRITTDDAITLNNYSSISSSTDGQADAGKIQLQTLRLLLSDGAFIDTLTSGQGNSGNLSVNASESVIVRGSTVVNSSNGESLPVFSNLSTQSFGSGNAGQITIDTRRLSLQNGGDILAGATSSGRGGDITVRATDTIEVFGVSPDGRFKSDLSSTTSGSGYAGNLIINTGRLSIREGGSISTVAVTRDSTGRGGNLTINASEAVEVVGTTPDGQFFSNLSASTNGAGNAGDITINTGRLSIRGGASVTTEARRGSMGQGGNLTINASDIVEVIGATPDGQSFSNLSASTNGAGNAGNLTINTRRLSIQDGGIVSTTAFPESSGQGGTLTINASDLLEVVGQSPDGLSFSVLETGTFGSGNAGSLNINTRRLSVRDGAVVTTGAFEGSTGQGGDLTVQATDSVDIVGASRDDPFNSIVTSITAGSGKAGRITIDTQRLSIRNGAYISASTLGSGQGGNLDIKAADSVEILASPTDTDGADGLFTSTVGSGNAGNLTLTTQRLSVRNGGAVSAATAPLSTGQGGNLTIDASDSVEVAGTSNDGNLQSLLSVRSRGAGQAGNITVNSPRISIKDKGTINAESSAADGGNITLNTNLLLLRRSGTISTTAGLAQGAGNGGNITINANAIVAVPNENSDITANAFQGRGGNITINTQGLFGIVPASFPTSQSDITASSELGVQGQISITQPEVQPGQGLIELPSSVVDASTQIAQICPRSPNDRPLGEFIITGRGSLQPNPLEPLAGTPNLSQLATLDGGDTLTQRWGDAGSFKASKGVTEIVEAQGWIKDSDGNIILVASAPNVTPNTRPTATACLVRQ
ncbi:hypothetical protein BZZ01_14085 [Nostocales cyanobacterium HT-58-2]|nr:hypothetical protein BZZ01_14085 [Nostocales cyanobacterium HT-58-2]